MKGRIKEDDSSVPMKDGPFAYGSSFRIGGEQPRYFRTPRDGGAGGRSSSTATWRPKARPISASAASTIRRTTASCSGRYDDKGSEFYTLAVRDLDGRRPISTTVSPTPAASGVWSAGNDGFFYTRLDANHRPSKIFYHRARHADRATTG